MAATEKTVQKLHNGCFALVFFGVFLTACIGESPEEALRAEQGQAEDGDEEHRPGQPCLVCHGADYSPGGPVFVLAGTIYEFASDPDKRGLQGAEVHITDSAGHEFSALTNRVGNFMVQVKSGLSAPQQRSKGRLSIPWDPEFPLDVAVIYQGEEKSMDSQIWRDGSCAGCHRGSEPAVDQMEKVWFSEPLP